MNPMLPEPWRVKVVEPIRLPPADERDRWLREGGFNLFRIPSEAVFIDLFTDSGTSAMSDSQWAGMMMGDESYAGSRNYFHLAEAVRDVFGYTRFLPVHQGRGAEHLLFAGLVTSPGMIVPSNMHFDTTRAHVVTQGGVAVDLPIPEALVAGAQHPFKGNIDLARLDRLFEETPAGRIPVAMLTLTNNAGGGQPVSLENIRAMSAMCKARGVPFYVDACRFAENAWFIKQREPGQGDRAVRDIARDIFDATDGCTMSAKKDGLANIGGFIASRDPSLIDRLAQPLLLYEGFPTYGGLAGRDLEAIARGLREVVDEEYLRFRVGQVEAFGSALVERGIPIVRPPGGHAIYIDARAFLPHIAPVHFPAQALACAIYREGGVRPSEVGTSMHGAFDAETNEPIPAPLDLVRLAVPRRVYTQAHLDYVVRVVSAVWQRRADIKGLRWVHAEGTLRHFTARFGEIG
jgi:tyrosine phenol-lyase